MDKVKVFLAVLGKYHFWLLCGLAVILGTFGWMSARGSLSADYQKNKSAVTGTFSKLTGVTGTANPPNENWTAAISELTKQEQKEVEATWNTVYDQQKKVLAWPEVMGSDFNTWITTRPPSEEIPNLYRQNYRTEVLPAEFPKLAQIVQAAPLGAETRNTPAPGQPTQPGARPAAAPAEPAAAAPSAPVRVQWENQEAVQKSLQFTGNIAPTSFEIRLRQEDYWVYQALLNIIRKTNDAAPHVPYIKAIEDLRLGAKAADLYTKGMAPGRIDKIVTAGGEGASSLPVESLVPPAEGGEAPPPDQDRYLQKDGTALPAGTAQTEQFKRLPVYLKLVMDQREITRLLTECANYPLPVEVRQLRIMPSGGSSQPAGRGQGGGAAPTAPGAPRPGEAYDVSVEISGIIYLFNPPDPAKLGNGAAETQSAG